MRKTKLFYNDNAQRLAAALADPVIADGRLHVLATARKHGLQQTTLWNALRAGKVTHPLYKPATLRPRKKNGQEEVTNVQS